jgi:transposase
VSTQKRLFPFGSHAEDVNGRNHLEILYSRCCGLDVHAKTVVACLCIEGEKPIRTFSTMTADLWQLADWLLAAGCTHIAMESTGVYWRPVFKRREDHFTILLVNAHHIKAVPGRKTEVRDCDWICDVLRHGLLKASFIPPRDIRERREWTRHRQILGRARAAGQG